MNNPNKITGHLKELNEDFDSHNILHLNSFPGTKNTTLAFIQRSHFIAFEIDKNFAVGRYKLSHSKKEESVQVIYNKPNGNGGSDQYPAISGTFEIISNANNILEAKFAFIAANVDNPNDIVTVERGEYYINNFNEKPSK